MICFTLVCISFCLRATNQCCAFLTGTLEAVLRNSSLKELACSTRTKAMHSGFLMLLEITALFFWAACELRPCCVCSCRFDAFPRGLQLECKERQLVLCHPAVELLSLQHEELLGRGLLWHCFLNSSASLCIKSFTEVIAKESLGTSIS